ncbi:MAG: hypothetical protein WCV73_02620 [Patescibacteria group bacterium]|jgi:hypothetical protein
MTDSTLTVKPNLITLRHGKIIKIVLQSTDWLEDNPGLIVNWCKDHYQVERRDVDGYPVSEDLRTLMKNPTPWAIKLSSLLDLHNPSDEQLNDYFATCSAKPLQIIRQD